MKTIRVKAVGLFLLLFLTGHSSAVRCSELSTNFTWDGDTYTSLQSAEEALRNSNFIGSAYYTYQYTWGTGTFRRYDHSPTPDYIEDPKLVFSSQPSFRCDPMYRPPPDQFGNDRCSNVPLWECCDSEAHWWEGVLEAWSHVDCPPIQTGQGPWVAGVLAAINYPMKLPEEYLMLQASYYKSINISFPEGGTSPHCGTDDVYNLGAISPAYCPGGYSSFGVINGVKQCHVTRDADITVRGAEMAEPGPNSCSVGNPCHPATGDKTLAENDFRSSTLQFTRHYHSLQIYPDHAAMGRGWSHTYSGRVLVDGSIIKVVDGRGDTERFRCTDSPACTTWVSESESGQILRPVSGGWDVFLKSGEVHQYDSSGKLILITHRSGTFREIAITYNGNGQVSLVIDQSGRALQFTYNADELVDSIALPDGQLILYDYEVPGNDTTNNPWHNLIRVTREDLSERHYHYEDANAQGTQRYAHLLTGITDENGVRLATYSYDDQPRVTSSEHAGGAGRIELNYTRRPGESYAWSITEVTMPLGELITYDMEAGPFRKLTDIEDSRGAATMSYDPATSWRTSRTDREGNQSTYVYDSLHETSRTEAVGTVHERVIETDWDDAVNRITERREPGKTTRYTYNARGQVLSEIVVDTNTLAARSTTYSYFELPSLGPLIGQVKTIDGPRTDVSDVTIFEYYTNDHPAGDYVMGDLKAVINALGHAITYLKYDKNGRPLTIRDANNMVTALSYHARGWIKSRTTDDQTTTLSYDSVGNLTRLTQPDGSYSSFEYDNAHRLSAISDNHGNRIDYTLDVAGNRIAENTYDEAGSLRRQLTRVYDQLNRLSMLLDGNNDPTLYSYDNNGNRTRTQDANLNVTDFEYDPLDRMVKTIDSTLGETLVDYDARDNLVSVTDPLGNITRYTHDGLDNLTRLDSPETGATLYEYDEAGNRVAATDARGIRTEYVYDALDRLAGMTYPDGALQVSFMYDTGTNGKGRLTRMTDSVGTVDYTYDARGNLLIEIRTIDTDQYITSHAYNEADRLIATVYPSGKLVEYTLDSTGRVIAIDTGLEPLISDIRYEPFGPVASFAFANGLTWSAVFDQDFELVSLQSGSELNWLLNHDSSGNILTISDQASGQYDQAFTYDDLYRIETASGSYGTETFDYDANGNRTRFLNSMVDEAYTYDPQSSRLATQNGWTFTRDASGNRTGKLDAAGYGRLYRFADHNRLSQTSIRDGLGDIVMGDYEYDGRGQRVRKTTGNSVTHYIYGPAGQLLGEYDAEGSSLKEYIYLNSQVVAVITTEAGGTPIPVEIIMDNDNPGTSSKGNWSLKENPKDFGENFRLGDHEGSYRWTPPPINGMFEVYAWWVSGKKSSKDAVYTIHHDETSDIIRRSQQSNAGQWNLLGTFLFDGSGEEFVELHSGNGRKIAADAIRFSEIDPTSSVTEPSESTHFVHTDHLGTPRSVSDETQTVVWRWDSPPFGNAIPNQDPDGNSNDFILNLRFPGQYYDEESGLHYNYFRTYDPEIGRYIESDPIGLGGGLNTFEYSKANPLGYFDFFGLDTEFCRRPFYPMPIPYARHCFVRYGDRGSSSFGPKGPGPDPAPDWWPESCQVTDGNQDDDCVKREMQKCEGEQYDFIGFNCCHCVEQAMNACGISIPRSDWPNWPVNPGPQPGEPGYKSRTGIGGLDP